MAKKKTENIKAVPVPRAVGVTPTPTPEQTETRTYQIMDPWKDMDKVNLVDVKAVDGEITDVKVNGVPAGGGGGGDLQIAQVTFINTGSKPYSLRLPTITKGLVKASSVDTLPNEQLVKSVIIGPEGCFSTFDDFPTTATATGGVRYKSGDVYITGNGTLTIA